MSFFYDDFMMMMLWINRVPMSLYTPTLRTQKKNKLPKQNYPGSVAFYDTGPGNEVGLFSL